MNKKGAGDIAFSEIIILSVTMMLYLIFAFGAFLLFADFIYSLIEKARMLRRLRTRENDMRGGEAERWLHRFLLTATGRRIATPVFVSLILIIFISVFLAGYRTTGLVTSFLLASSSALLPFLLLWMRICGIRRRGSHEAERLVSGFLREYRISKFNVYEAIEKVVIKPEGIKITAKLLSKLLYNLRSTGDPAFIKKATEEFAYSIRTNWSLMLAHDICMAAVKGTNISLAAEDILIQLREARTMVEERKRLNSEAAKMTFYMVPLIYLTTLFMAIKYLDITPERLIQNQFGTKEGIILFFFIAFFFIVNMALIQLVINQRFDY